MINSYSLIRLIAVGTKYLSILSIPIIFSAEDIALFSLLLAAERFISFVCSLEVHSYFNRRLIHRNYSPEFINNQHMPLFLVGIIISFAVGFLYSFQMHIFHLYIYIMIISICGAIQNEMVRRSQAMGNIKMFSILSALKSVCLFISIIFIVLTNNMNFVFFVSTFATVCILMTFFSIFFYKAICMFSPRKIWIKSTDLRYLKASFLTLNKFFIQGGVVFSLALIERTLIANNYSYEYLASHYAIQSIALAVIILMDIFYWGPMYSKLINRLKNKNVHLKDAIKIYGLPIFGFQIFLSISFVLIVFVLSIISLDWQNIILNNISWIIFNIFLILLIPIDTFMTYFIHSKKIDIKNTLAGIFGLISMIIFYMSDFSALYIPFGLILYYVITILFKYFSFYYKQG